MRLRFYENYRFVRYAPFYAAHVIGDYAAKGLAVELLPSPVSDWQSGPGSTAPSRCSGRGRCGS
jgi:hypothetical protein